MNALRRIALALAAGAVLLWLLDEYSGPIKSALRQSSGQFSKDDSALAAELRGEIGRRDLAKFNSRFQGALRKLDLAEKKGARIPEARAALANANRLAAKGNYRLAAVLLNSAELRLPRAVGEPLKPARPDDSYLPSRTPSNE